ncbi:MAG: UDP-N-acetylglucosamine 2-epimerase [Betaproteobacteria bacterium]|nr:UDP-N-acetylglucosamine 2-epimerase [Betaproteobacteria bacterium]
MRVLVVSTHRSDKGHYDRLLRVLRATPGLDVILYAVNDFYTRPNYIEAVRPLAVLRGKNTPQRIDVGVVLGDRYEMLLAAMQLMEARIPLVHIHGGEHTYGSLDERWRWAISEIADVICVATTKGMHLGTGSVLSHGRGWHLTGAPGLDDIRERQSVNDADTVLVLINPVTTEQDTIAERVAIDQAILRMTPYPRWIVNNGDRHAILRGAAYESWAFRDRLAAAHVIVGNSSAGIIEAPSLGTWCVNVGDRQAGRVRAGNVIDVSADPVKICAAIEDALSRPRYSGPNPYEHPQGKACEAIRDVLLGIQNGADNRRDRESGDCASGATSPSANRCDPDLLS